MRVLFTSGLHNLNIVEAVLDSDGDVFLTVRDGHKGTYSTAHVTHEGAVALRDLLNHVLDGPVSRYEGEG